MDNQTFTLESFKNIQELIKFTDQKSGGVLVVAGLELTVFLNVVDKLIFKTNSFGVYSVVVFVLGVITAGLLIAIVYVSVFKVLRPQLANHYSGNEASLFYFNHLASMTDKTAMFEQFKNVDDNLILRNLTDQIFEVSKIMNRKTNALHCSMNLLFYSMVSIVLFILVTRFI